MPASTVTSVSQPTPKPILLSVPTGMALKVGLDRTVRIHRVGQPIHGTIVEPVYAFDQMVVPAGTAIVGAISAIDPVPKKRCIVAAMNGELSPSRQVHIVFTDLVLAGGRHVPVKTDVSLGSGTVLQFLSAGETREDLGKKNKAKNTVTREISEAEKAVKRDWEAAKMQLEEPGKIQKLTASPSLNFRTIPNTWILGPALTWTYDVRWTSDSGGFLPTSWSASGHLFLRGAWYTQSSSRRSIRRTARRVTRWKHSSPNPLFTPVICFFPKAAG
jgi:hypothetical protein